jgi:diadenylate cyclase
MRIITLFAGGTRYVIGDSATILSRAHQALATLERCKLRLNEASGALTALEIEDLVTVRDVISVGQQLEMARRIAAEIEEYMIELGTDSRLLALQLEELATGTDPEQRLLVQDYTPASHDTRSAAVAALGRLHEMSQQALLVAGAVAAVLGLGGPANLDISISPRGYRLLAKVPRLPEPAAGRLVEHFGGLQKIMAATVDELQRLEGVGSSHARSVREGLSRLAESSLLERYS